MTHTVDTLMALADAYANYGQVEPDEAREALRAALTEALAPQAVPAGFVLVPVEPTIAMKACCELSMANSTSEIYKAMLAAAPKGAV